MRSPLVSAIDGAFRKGARTIALLIAINFAWVLIALALRSPKPPGTPAWMNQPGTIVQAVATHVVAGFLVGAATLSIERGLIGAAFQPLIDIDHLTAYVHLPVDPRVGHSLVLMVVLVVVAGALKAWPWGVADLGLFASSEFLIHFAVAPPGFPLLTPLTPTTFFFPSVYAAAPGLVIVAANFWLSRVRNRGSARIESRPTNSQS